MHHKVGQIICPGQDYVFLLYYESIRNIRLHTQMFDNTWVEAAACTEGEL